MTNTRKNLRDLIGNTPVVRIPSLSELTKCDIFLKCENLNPGGSVKDRAAKGMVEAAVASGALKPGKKIVEGTAGNTGIGLALVGRSYGIDSVIVMPNNQSPQKVAVLQLYGAEVRLVDPVPFANQNHFFHTARRIAEENPAAFWWANQFDNLDNCRAHQQHTAPEIYAQLNGQLDFLISVAGSGGTIAGNSIYLKEKIKGLKVYLCDPGGSGLRSFFHTGEFKAEGNSFSEGIGIMRLVENFKQAKVDDAFSLDDADAVAIAHFVRERDGIVLGTSAALNVAACVRTALKAGPGKRLLTFWCDVGERSATKLYDEKFLREQGVWDAIWQKPGNDKGFLERFG